MNKLSRISMEYVNMTKVWGKDVTYTSFNQTNALKLQTDRLTRLAV